MGQKLQLTLEDIVKKIKYNCDKDDFIYVLSELLGYACVKYGDSLIDALEPIIDEIMRKAEPYEPEEEGEGFLSVDCDCDSECYLEDDKPYPTKVTDRQIVNNLTQKMVKKKFKIKTTSLVIDKPVFAPYLPLTKR